MSIKEVRYESDAMNGILRGMGLFAKTVGTTLGPKGRHVCYDKSQAVPTVTKDGVTVAKEIELEDPLQNLGCSLLRVSAAKSSDTSGDGTTTATVLAQAIMQEGWRYCAAGHDPRGIKIGLEKALVQVKGFLQENRRIVKLQREVAQIGTQASNGDEQIGSIIADAMDQVGQDGIITVEESKSVETHLKVIEGIKIDSGYMAVEFADEGTLKVEFENPYILVTDKKINSLHDIENVLNEVIETDRPLVVLCDHMVDEALKVMIMNYKKKVLKACPIRAYGVGDKRTESLRDIAIVTGATFITDQMGLSLPNMTLQHLGQADNAIINQRDALILGGKGKADNIQQRIAEIKTEMRRAWSEFDIEKFQDRLGRLVGGIATIYVGAVTDTELKEKKARVEDALNATQSAVTTGILPGGGIAYFRAIKAIDLTAASNEVEGYGMKILAKVLETPLRKIVSNAGIDPSGVITNISLPDKPFSWGYNAKTDRYEDLYESGIMDPLRVVIGALEGAVSLAGTVLGTGAVIYKIERD